MGRTFHRKGFVRTLVVEDIDELIEASLLLQEIGRGRFGGFLLEGEVHAFMTGVLLGRTWFDSFDADAQAQPPDSQLAEVEQGVCGSEGDAVIRVCGQTTFAKKPFK